MFESQKFRITVIRIIEVFCKEILKGPENFVRISKSSHYTSSNQTEVTVHTACGEM